MSGAPNKEDVTVLVSHMLRAQSLSSQKRQYEAQVREAQAELEKVEEELRPLLTRIQQLLSSMDVEAPGNFGHENRVTSLSFLILQEGLRRGRAEVAEAEGVETG